MAYSYIYKMKNLFCIYNYATFFFFLLCLTSCSEDDIGQNNSGNVIKRLEITFTGDMENISKWAYFTVYTEDGGTLKYIGDEDTTMIYDGLYMSKECDFYNKRIIFEKEYMKFTSSSGLHFAITYLKRTSESSDLDNLYINIKAFKNNKLYKEENHMLRSFELTERPIAEEYIYRFTFY